LVIFILAFTIAHEVAFNMLEKLLIHSEVHRAVVDFWLL